MELNKFYNNIYKTLYLNLLMSKRGFVFILSLFLISFVSAFSHYGYGRFSLTDFLRNIDPSTMILGALFIIFFAIINMALGKVFKDQYGYPNRAVAGIVAFAVSTLIIYGINRYGFDIEGLFYGIGLSANLLYIILPIILLAGAIFIVWRWHFYTLFLIFGLLLILLTFFTDVFYEKGLVLAIGVVTFLIGLFLWGRTRRGIAAVGRGIGRGSRWIGRKYNWEREKREARAIGRGVGWLGKKAVTKTLGKTPLIKGRLMSKKRAEEAAYQEEAERRAIAGRGRARRERELQRAYDHHKAINQNTNAPPNARDMAYQEMGRIAQQAASEGIRLRY